MRIAAGILMIIGAIMSLAAFGNLPGEPAKHIAFGLTYVYAGFTLSGGILALKRKHWDICFISSLLLSLFLIYSFFFLSTYTFFFLLPGGILPIVFVCLSKREWSQSQA